MTLIKMPHAPKDRINGRVVLTDGNGRIYIPKFKNDETGDTSFRAYKIKWRTWRQLMLNCGYAEPSSQSNGAYDIEFY